MWRAHSASVQKWIVRIYKRKLHLIPSAFRTFSWSLSETRMKEWRKISSFETVSMYVLHKSPHWEWSLVLKNYLLGLMPYLCSGYVSSKTDEDRKRLRGKQFHTINIDMHIAWSKRNQCTAISVPAPSPPVTSASHMCEPVSDGSFSIQDRFFLECRHWFHRIC